MESRNVYPSQLTSSVSQNPRDQAPLAQVGILCNALKTLQQKQPSQEKRIILYNRWGNDVRLHEIENTKWHRDRCDLMVIFYDKNTSNKSELVKELKEEKNICLLSYEEITDFLQREVWPDPKDGEIAKKIISALEHLNSLTKVGWVGRTIDEALLIDPLIMGLLCKKSEVLEDNKFVLFHQHMTKTYDPKWIELACKTLHNPDQPSYMPPPSAVVMGNPNVILLTKLSRQTLDNFYSLVKKLPKAIEKDFTILNRADYPKRYGKYENCYLRSHKSTMYTLQVAPYVNSLEGEGTCLNIQSKDYQYILSTEKSPQPSSWSSKIVYDSLEQLLDSMIERMKKMGKIETLKMLLPARKISALESLTEAELMQLIAKKIEDKHLKSQDFTNKLIVKSIDPKVLELIEKIPALTNKELNVDYTAGSLGKERRHKYKEDYNLNEEKIGQEKKGYKKNIDTKTLEAMLTLQRKYNQRLQEKNHCN